MTVKEYAKLAGIVPSAISYRIKNNSILPGIKEYSKINRQYELVRDLNIADEDIKKYFRNK